MLRDKMKRWGAMLLAFCLIVTAVQFPPREAGAAENANLARSATAAASNSENTDNGPANINDGDTASRWATDNANDADVERTVTLTWQGSQAMKSFSILWERRTVQNLVISVSDTGADGSWQEVFSRNANSSALKEEIILDQAVNAKYLRLSMSNVLLTDPDNITANWRSVSICELEVYAGEIPDGRSDAQKIIDGITAPVLGDGDAKIPMPQAPEGVSVRFCADYEQVIGGDGTVYKPLEAKTVKGFYEVSSSAGGEGTGKEVLKTAEFTIEVPGQYAAGGNGNAKPDVIPELQEWHGAKGNFIAGASGRIIFNSAGLSETAKAFAQDYKEVTGSDITVVDGTQAAVQPSAGDFSLSLASGSGLGKEGYAMEIGDAVSVTAEQATGAYWATRTILQIIKQNKGSMPKGLVRDYPKYEVRGFMLDVGRKPITLDQVKQFAKNMAWYKMNSFHVHLSDNLIFHEDYPDLATAAAQSYAGNRLESGVVNEETGKTATSEDVFYTKDEFRSFIQDSRQIGIDVVPEFDMPAHALPFTRAFPQYQSYKAGGDHGYLIEELNLEADGVIDWVKDIWNDYFDGDNPVFDKETTVHIGTDEYHGTSGQAGKELFRQFSAEMIKFVQSKGRTVRMWGSLTNKSGNTPVPSEDVQLNLWETSYSNPRDMYNLGYDMINTLNSEGLYIVPKGTGKRGTSYSDYLDPQYLYNNFLPNKFGSFTVPAGDDQMLGGCYALWHDNIDTRANGISAYDSFDRFFEPLPHMSAKLWGDPEKSYEDFTSLIAQTGTAPGTTIRGDVDSVSSIVADYKFDGDALTKDSSANGYDLTEPKNVAQTAVEGEGANAKALKLSGGKSYVEAPFDLIGSDAVLTMRVKMDADASGEQILCESKSECGSYGTYAFKAAQAGTGKVGFSREGYHFSFDYTLQPGEWHTLEFHSGQDTVALYVDGELVDDDPDIYFASHPDTELSNKITAEGLGKVATMLAPLGRIGSKGNSFKGEIDRVTVSANISGDLGKADRDGWELDACSTSPKEGSREAVMDGNESTFWHQDYDTDTSMVSDIHPEGAHWFELTLPRETEVAKLTYLPRQDSVNGRILKYSIVVTDASGEETTVVDQQTWADDNSLKTAVFDPVKAKKVKLLIHESKNNHATIAELNLYAELPAVAAAQKNLADYMAGCSVYKREDYGEMVWNKYAAALDSAQKLAESDSEAAEDYIAALERLERAVKDLVLSRKEEKKGVLDEAVAEAEDMLAGIEESEYTEESVNALKTAIEKAKEELSSAEATAVSLETIRKALASVKLETSAYAAKREELQGAVSSANTLAANTNYTAESLQALKQAIAKAVEAIQNGAAEDELQARLKAIEDAKVKLSFITYTVKFNSDGGTAVKAQSVKIGTKATKPADPARSGYTFQGWSKAKGGTAVAWPLAISGDTELYALWKKNEQPQQPQPKFEDGATMTDPKTKISYKVASAAKKTAVVTGTDDKTAAKVAIPESVVICGTKCKVVTVGKTAFKNCKKLTGVTVGKNVTSIEQNAFLGCRKLKKVMVKGKKLTAVKPGAFKNTAKNLILKVPKGMKKTQKNKLIKALKKCGNKNAKVK